MATIAHNPTEEAISFMVYPIQYAAPTQVIDAILMMMPSTNHLSLKPIEKKLLVHGTKKQHTVVHDMLRLLDIPPKKIRIGIELNTTCALQKRTFETRLDRLIILDPPRGNPVVPRDDGDQPVPIYERSEKVIVIRDGQCASLRIADLAPRNTWLTHYGQQHGNCDDTEINWREVSSFLIVKPTLISRDLIRIRLIPEVSGQLADGTCQRIQFTHLATEVIARDGETLSLSNLDTDREFSAQFFRGGTDVDQAICADITLTSRILLESTVDSHRIVTLPARR